MKQKRTYILLILLTILSFQSKADSWIDPSWKDMLDNSELTALVEYTSEGDFRASAKILKVYKGSLKAGDEIWISGFSNRYGPIDKMKVGDTYLVFLNFAEPTKERINSWTSELIEKPELKNYVDALVDSRVFYVQTATSGDLKVKGNKVQYDLVQTTNYQKQHYHSLKDFEDFLFAYEDENQKRILTKKLLNKIKPASFSDVNCQNLMKLYLLGYSDYNKVFKRYVKVKNVGSRYALALLMGNINTKESQEILLKLLNDKNTLVQGEAVRQLSINSSDEVGAVLLKKLKHANPYNLGSGNIMNPVMNRIQGGKIQIIKTLGDIGYKPAIPELLKMLVTTDDYEFTLIVDALRKLGTREYSQYINRHLEDLNSKMVFDLCYIISEDSLTECIPSLMTFVQKHDRTIWPTREVAISSSAGLAFFKTDTVQEFLKADFLEVMKMPSTAKESIDTKQKWVNEYIDVFIDLDIRVPKDILYDNLYGVYGINNGFKLNPQYFQRKKEVEDSLIQIVEQLLKPINATIQVSALAFIDSDFKITDYSVKYKVKLEENQSSLSIKTLDTLNAIIYRNTSIDKNHLIWATERMTQLNGATNITAFNSKEMNLFLKYISTSADQEDVLFLENLLKYNYAEREYDKERLENYLIKAKKQ